MLITFGLDGDHSGSLESLLEGRDKTLLSQQAITGVRPVGVRNKAQKIANDYRVDHHPDLDRENVCTINILTKINQASLATITIDRVAKTYTCKLTRRERSRGLTLHLEVSTQKVRKPS